MKNELSLLILIKTLKNKISKLEKELKDKDEELEQLKYELHSILEEQETNNCEDEYFNFLESDVITQMNKSYRNYKGNGVIK